ncbi:hypothetical protein DERF_003328 [Dermatophagoides farinae]|uniref:Uncharacterized protein n=1 Tax=Dermatophagoides farinae TaxID=6954 RepID=A0A922IH42_DERFA|nr:hypothetical protein DERF_003328 [Dermatophagoides farinae]
MSITDYVFFAFIHSLYSLKTDSNEKLRFCSSNPSFCDAHCNSWLVLVEFHVVIVVDCDSGDDGGRGGCGNDSGPEFITTNK